MKYLPTALREPVLFDSVVTYIVIMGERRREKEE
jgi:hypothetical protein